MAITSKEMTLNEIRRIGLQALRQNLEPVAFVRFLQQYETGYGNYTDERNEWLSQMNREAFLKQVKSD